MVGGTISREHFERLQKKYEQQSAILNQANANITGANIDYYKAADCYLELPELMNRAWFSAPMEIKAHLLKMLTSKILIKDKEPSIVFAQPFNRLYSFTGNKEWLPRLDSNQQPCD